MSQVSAEFTQQYSAPVAERRQGVSLKVVSRRQVEVTDIGVPVSTVLKQIAMTPEDMLSLRRITLKTRNLGKKEVDGLSAPNDRHLSLLEAYWLLAVAPDEFWKGREDELEPQEHSEAAYICEHWLAQPAVVRALALIRLEKAMPKRWTLDRKSLTPAIMASSLRWATAMC